MKSPLALLAIALLGVAITACGGASKGAGSASGASSNAAAPGGAPATTASGATSSRRDPRRDSDGDNDNNSNSYYDRDDNALLNYGHAASAADKRTITALVKSYYAAAAAGDGAKACPLVYSLVAESVAEDYGQPSGAAAAGGNTCAAVMSKLFKQHHQQLTADVATMAVTGVRVDGEKALALLRLGPTPEHNILLHLDGGVWKIEALFDVGMP